MSIGQNYWSSLKLHPANKLHKDDIEAESCSEIDNILKSSDIA